MRSCAVWALLLLACASQKPQVPARSTTLPVPGPAPPAPPMQAPSEPRTNDQICQADGFDFAYTFIESEGVREMVCGVGPGTPCGGNRCDGKKLMHCHDGKLGMIDCSKDCREIGDGSGVTYDSGTCRVSDAGPACACCDAGEPGCEGVKSLPRGPVVPLSGVRLGRPPE